MTHDEIKADLVRRATNMANDLRHEWAALGADAVLEMSETTTGVSISVVEKVAVKPKPTGGDDTIPLRDGSLKRRLDNNG